MKILLLDVEVAPLTAHAWRLHDVTIGINQIVQSGYTLCWSAKWYGKSKMHQASRYKTTARKMLAPLHKLIDEADCIVSYNGRAFDLKIVRKDFLLNGFKPPSPHKDIDLLQVMRSRFRMASNKLDYVVRQLGLGSKMDVGGHQTWIDCMNGEERAFRKMLKYNAIDVKILEKLYVKLVPWINSHPNHGVYDESSPACPSCGKHHLNRRGYARSATAKYARYQCQDCGAWSKEGFSDTSRIERQRLLRPSV